MADRSSPESGQPPGEQQPWHALRPYGLTEYQARAYWGLVGLSQGSAADVAAASGVPQPKLYRVLKDLAAKGLVEATLGHPTTYSAVPVDRFLRQEARRLRDEANAMERDAPALVQRFQPADRPSGRLTSKFRAVEGGRNVLESMRDLIQNAESTVFVAGTDALLRGSSTSTLEDLGDLSAAGVDVRVLLTVTSNNVDDARELARHARVRHDRRQSASFAVVADARDALMGHSRALPGQTGIGRKSGIRFNDPAMVHLLENALDALWDDGVPLEDRADELAGRPRTRLRLLRTPKAAHDAVRTFIEPIQRTLDVRLDEMGAFQMVELRADLQALADRGAKCRVLVSRTPRNSTAVDVLAEVTQVKPSGSGPGVYLIGDDHRCVLLDLRIENRSPFLEPEAFGTQSLVAENHSLAAVLARQFQHEWDGGT